MEFAKMLNELYRSIVNMPTSIRGEICKDCNWSLPTFYRKVGSVGDFPPPVSKAEFEKILSIIKEFHIDQLNIIKIYEDK